MSLIIISRYNEYSAVLLVSVDSFWFLMILQTITNWHISNSTGESRGESQRKHYIAIPEKKKPLAEMEVGELYVRVNMGFSPSRISFLLHLSKDYFAS